MTDFAIPPRPPLPTALAGPVAPSHPETAATRRVQPVGPALAQTLSPRPDRGADFPLRNLPKDRVAPPSLMQLQIGAWLETQARDHADRATDDTGETDAPAPEKPAHPPAAEADGQQHPALSATPVPGGGTPDPRPMPPDAQPLPGFSE